MGVFLQADRSREDDELGMLPSYAKEDLKGKKILLRVDINSPIKNGKLEDSRIRAHSKTIKELSEKGARVIVLAHQGRVGDDDFSSLSGHSKLLEKYTKVNMGFAEDILGPHAKSRINAMKNSDVLLLENIRFLAEETLEKKAKEHSKSIFVRTLSSLADVYVNDAFSCSHRSHASIVGFPFLMKSYAGSVMSNEVEGLERIKSSEKLCLVLGGSKPEDVLDFLKHLAPKAERILLGGMVGELFLHANGTHLGEKGKVLQEKFSNSIEQIRNVYKEHQEKFMLPVDVAIESDGQREELELHEINGMTFDIGSKTTEMFHDAIIDSEMILMKGPMGAYENELFLHGSRNVIKSMEHATGKGSFSVVCGGHTSSIAESFGFRPSHVSLAGGAFLKYLSGGKLPGIEALRGIF